MIVFGNVPSMEACVGMFACQAPSGGPPRSGATPSSKRSMTGCADLLAARTAILVCYSPRHRSLPPRTATRFDRSRMRRRVRVLLRHLHLMEDLHYAAPIAFSVLRVVRRCHRRRSGGDTADRRDARADKLQYTKVTSSKLPG